jgi:hypothetical protein
LSHIHELEHTMAAAPTPQQTANTMKHLRRGLKNGFVPDKYIDRAPADLSLDDVELLATELEAMVAARYKTAAWAAEALYHMDRVKLAVHMEHLARTGIMTPFLSERRAAMEKHPDGAPMLDFGCDDDHNTVKADNEADQTATRWEAATSAGCEKPGPHGCFSGVTCIRNWGRARKPEWVSGKIKDKAVWWCSRDCQRAKGASKAKAAI